MHYQMQMYNVISVTLCTTVGPQCDVIQSNFVFRVRVDVHLHRVHILVYCLFVVSLLYVIFTASCSLLVFVNSELKLSQPGVDALTVIWSL